jgi:prepilin-type N-terminal cleavage/methylation domain-containing protein
MKLQVPSSGPSWGGSSTPDRGFTLPEILIALTVFMLMLAGIISSNLFGLKMFYANQTKLNATGWSRNTFGRITEEIQSCNSLSILNVDTNGNFTGLLPTEKQQGNGLQIFPTANTNKASYTIYFANLSDKTFRRTVAMSGVSTNTVIVADAVTNAVVFYAQDLSGNVLTNNQGNDRVIHLTLDFYQPGSYKQDPYSYQLETSVTRRAN